MSVTPQSLMFLAQAGGLPSTWREGDWATPMLVLLLGVALGVCLVGLVVILALARHGRWTTRLAAARTAPPRGANALPVGPRGPSRWLAVKCETPQLVQAALRLHKPIRCSWEQGLWAVRDHKLFISPAISGWVLVLGSGLPDPAQDVDRCFRFVLELSRKLGHVQFFSFHRTANHHAWVQAESGCVKRAYAWAETTLWNQGKLTRAERELGLRCLDYGEVLDRFHQGPVDPFTLNTERIPLLAARWSVDPGTLDARLLRESHGIAGELSRSRRH